MKRIILILLICLTQSMFGQDYHLSQYHTAPSFINSSYIGVFDGDIQASFHTRNQWQSIMNKPYVTNVVNFGYKIPKWGKKFTVGTSIINDIAGQGSFQTFTGKLLLGYTQSYEDNHFWSIGGSAGVFNKSVDFGSLNLPDQYSINNGGSFSLPSSDLFNSNQLSVMLADFNVGVNYFYRSKNHKVIPYFGASFSHIGSLNESLLKDNAILPNRISTNVGVETKINNKNRVKLQYLFMEQQLAEINLIDLLYQYELNEKRAILAGISHRFKDAVIGWIALKNNNWQYGFSYDNTTSSLSNYNGGTGAFEISILYNIKLNNEIAKTKGCSIY